MKSHRAFCGLRAHTLDGGTTVRLDRLTLDDLDHGDVLVRVAYSDVGYRDAMAAVGIGKNVRTDRPCVLGLDLAGIVERSTDARFKDGDSVVATSYGLGSSHDGGYAEYARVPADWLVPLPGGLSLRDAMVVGGPGLTAALAIDRLEHAGLSPEQGPVLVSGATGGIGSLAIDMLSSRGYDVTAVTGKLDAGSYLRKLGATEVIDRADLLKDKRALGKELWAGAIDTAGGDVLDAIARTMRSHGRVAVCGMTMGLGITTNVLPLILRAVDFLGINVGRAFSMPDRIRIWNRVAGDLRPRHLESVARSVGLSELPLVFDALIRGTVTGRIVVDMGGEPATPS